MKVKAGLVDCATSPNAGSESGWELLSLQDSGRETIAVHGRYDNTGRVSNWPRCGPMVEEPSAHLGRTDFGAPPPERRAQRDRHHGTLVERDHDFVPTAIEILVSISLDEF